MTVATTVVATVAIAANVPIKTVYFAVYFGSKMNN